MNQTKTISYDSRVTVFWTIAAFSILLVVLYFFAINATIRNTVARRDLEGEVATLAARASSLEFAYITAKNKIDMQVAYEHGFSEVSRPAYVSRTNTSLTYNR